MSLPVKPGSLGAQVGCLLRDLQRPAVLLGEPFAQLMKSNRTDICRAFLSESSHADAIHQSEPGRCSGFGFCEALTSKPEVTRSTFGTECKRRPKPLFIVRALLLTLNYGILVHGTGTESRAWVWVQRLTANPDSREYAMRTISSI